MMNIVLSCLMLNFIWNSYYVNIFFQSLWQKKVTRGMKNSIILVTSIKRKEFIIMRQHVVNLIYVHVVLSLLIVFTADRPQCNANGNWDKDENHLFSSSNQLHSECHTKMKKYEALSPAFSGSLSWILLLFGAGLMSEILVNNELNIVFFNAINHTNVQIPLLACRSLF